ncbi:hypothetical protein MBRA1_002638 [Malassezia brasiliensis]|uniref:PXA domain-containing protein n=1 Tax=Malassezia brasiliensis TaxID=1821822 RepID=A0AAF0DV62_9BASI|nr:hypothetical protein MBRA1_002638 [Malassezia brasiliensis]
MTLVVNAALGVLGLMVLRLGVWATVLTTALVVMLLCHPMVHTFLEVTVPNRLVSDQSTARDEAHVRALQGRLTHLAQQPKHTLQGQGRMGLDSVPKELRPELMQLLALIQRDFIQYWYDPLTLGDTTFPREAIGSLEHLISQVSLRLEQFRRANVATELSLTALSVLVAALRRRRTAQAAESAGAVPSATESLVPGLWKSSVERIESLRASISTLLLQSLPYEDRKSPALVQLLTEVLTKQAWETIQSQSDPDVINQYIVQYGQKSAGTAITAMALGEVPDDVEAAAQRSADSMLHSAPDLASSVTSTLGSAVAVSAPAVAGAAEQTAGVLQEAYAALAGAVVGDEASLPQDAPAAHGTGLAPASERRAEPRPAAAATQPKAAAKTEGKAEADDPCSAATETPGAPRSTAQSKAPSKTPTTAAPPALPKRTAATDAPRPAPTSAPATADTSRAPSPKSSCASPALPPRAPPRRASTPADAQGSVGDLLSLEDATANPWSTDPAPSAPAKTASSLASGPHQGALVDTNLLDLENELDDAPRARPMDIPKEMREPPLPQSLKQSKYDAPLAYEPRRSHSPRPMTIADVLASRDPEQLDPFESYVASIDSAHAAQRRRPEGAVLMQLHANLDALARTADHHSTTPELFESDVRAILQHAFDMLPEHETPPATRNALVRPAIRAALDRPLSTPASMSSVQKVVLARLQQLWDAYVAHNAPRRLAYEPRRPPSRTSMSTGVARVRSPELQRNVASTEGITTISVVDVSANAERAGPIDVRTLQVLISIEDVASNTGGYVLLRSWAQFEALHAELERMYAQRPDDTVLSAPPPPLPSLRGKSSPAACEALQAYLTALLVRQNGAVTWYSTTQAVQRFIDKTRAEDEPLRKNSNLISSIGDVGRSFASGVTSAAGSARKGLGQGIGQIGAVAPSAVNAPARIGTGLSRGLFGAKEPRSGGTLASPVSSTRSSFDDRSLLDASTELPKPPLPARSRISQPLEHLDAGSDSGRGTASDSEKAPRSEARNQAEESSAAEARSSSETRVSSAAPAAKRPQPSDAAKPVPNLPPRKSSDASTDKPTKSSGKSSGKPKKAEAAPTTPPAAEEAENLAPQDIDALLTAIFAVAHEAFNLQGAWTLRRGLLRVLEQVVRTTYSTSVVSTLVYFSSTLKLSALASWLEALRTTLWPNGVWKSEGAPPRTAAQKQATAAEARQIVLSYTPTQAAYAIGMGGKQACMDALTIVHEVITDPVVSLDLHLALVLRVLDLAMGTASGDRGL